MMRRMIVVGLILLISTYPSLATELYSNQLVFTNQQKEVAPLNSLQGRYIVLDSMATWCAPCRISMLDLQEVHNAIDGGDEAIVFTMSMDPSTDSVDKVKEFMDEFDAEWSYGLDHTEDIKHLLNVTGYPTTFIISPDGEVLHTWLGLTSSETIIDELSKYVEIDPSYIRNQRISYLLSSLFNSPLVYVFLIIMWVLIFRLLFGMINKLSEKPIEK